MSKDALPLLTLTGVTMRFGGLIAVSDLDLNLLPGEILGLIGPNGAGKTTVFNIISGIYQPNAGSIHFSGRDITNYKPHSVVQAGLARTFQLVNLFDQYTVFSSIIVAFHLQATSGFWRSILRSRSYREEENNIRGKAMEILTLVDLMDYKDELAGNLSHGHKKILGLAMALSCAPKALLLDEPVDGMNDAEISSMMSLLLRIRKDLGIAILLIEHNVNAVMSTCDHILVMNYGKKIAEGVPQKVRQNPEVIQAYLGVDGNVA